MNQLGINTFDKKIYKQSQWNNIVAVDEAKTLISRGKLDEALQMLVESDNPNGIILQSRILYHQGHLEDAYKSIATRKFQDSKMELKRKILEVIYSFEIGKIPYSEEILKEIEREKPILKTSNNDIKSFYFFAKGLIKEYLGHIDSAENDFLDALKLLEANNDSFEMNFIHYKIARMNQLQGNLTKAINHLQESLQLSMKLELDQSIATNFTLLGQNNLMLQNYDVAENFIDQGIEYWGKSQSPFGLAWALGEYAIIKYLKGEKNQALELFIKLYKHNETRSSAFNLSFYITQIIKIAAEIDNLEICNTFIQTFEDLKNTSSSDAIEKRFLLSQSLIKSASNRLSEKMQALGELKKIEKSDEYILQVEALINQCKLLLVEIEITESELLKKELIKEAAEISLHLLRKLQLNQNITMELIAKVIRSDIEILRGNQILASSLVDEANEEAGKKEIALVTKLIQERKHKIDEEKSKYSQAGSLDLNKNIHSIPKLKILLYLIPRIKVSFSEIQKAIGISSGNLNGQLKKLEELEYVAKDKMFVNEKPTTMYSITVIGFQEFRLYSQGLVQILETKKK